jgi:hypothetical protein
MGLLKQMLAIIKRPAHQPEDDYIVKITTDGVGLSHDRFNINDYVKWSDIQSIILVNTDEGPWMPDVWLKLICCDSKCMIPQGAKGYDEVYDIVSKYENFKFENVINSMTCTDNMEFPLWSRV